MEMLPATVTPFAMDGRIDVPSLERHLVETGSASGVTGIVVNGHAGEVCALSRAERREVVAIARSVLPEDCTLVAGIEDHNLEQLNASARDAVEAGADELLVLPPFDVRPYRRLARRPQSVVELFANLSSAAGVPLIVFQYPESSGCAYSLESLQAAAELEAVTGIKAATESLADYVRLDAAVGGNVRIYAASDGPLLLPMLLHGATGALIGIAAIATAVWSRLASAIDSGQAGEASTLFRDVCLPLSESLFDYHQPRTEVSPFAAVKFGLHAIGQIDTPFVRPPSISPDRARCNRVLTALAGANVELPSDNTAV